MGIITNVKQAIGAYLFQRRLSLLKRNKRLVNLNEARTIVIVYNVTNHELFIRVKRLIKELSTKKRQVMALGFINRKSIPNYCVAANSGYYFNLRDLNWYGGPKNDYLKEFINKENDILIDLTDEDIFVTQYIVGLSRSKLKVGRYSKVHEKYCDLMLMMDKTSSIDSYIDQILHYLLILKSK